MSEQNIQRFLINNELEYREIKVPGSEFPPPPEFWTENNILRCKNLFFRDNHGKNHFLVIFDFYKNLNIKKLSAIIGRGSLSFASGWRLDKYLGLTPGYLSLFGILNDSERHVKVIVDTNLRQDKALSFLPNTKGGSFIAIEYSEMIKLVNIHGNLLTEADL